MITMVSLLSSFPPMPWPSSLLHCLAACSGAGVGEDGAAEDGAGARGGAGGGGALISPAMPDLASPPSVTGPVRSPCTTAVAGLPSPYV